jgi:hypothetical protein
VESRTTKRSEEVVVVGEERRGVVTAGEVRQEANSSELKTQNLNGGGKEREAFFA